MENTLPGRSRQSNAPWVIGLLLIIAIALSSALTGLATRNPTYSNGGHCRSSFESYAKLGAWATVDYRGQFLLSHLPGNTPGGMTNAQLLAREYPNLTMAAERHATAMAVLVGEGCALAAQTIDILARAGVFVRYFDGNPLIANVDAAVDGIIGMFLRLAVP